MRKFLSKILFQLTTIITRLTFYQNVKLNPPPRKHQTNNGVYADIYPRTVLIRDYE
jgi:hypothetical protein